MSPSNLALGSERWGSRLKDKRAITRQWLERPEVARVDLKPLEGSRGIRLLKTSYHTNKLKTSPKGEPFYRVSGNEGDDRGVQQRLDHLCEFGMPTPLGRNVFGRGNTVAIGLRALDGHRIRDKRLMHLESQRFKPSSSITGSLLGQSSALRRALLGDWLKKKKRVEVACFDDSPTHSELKMGN